MINYDLSKIRAVVFDLDGVLSYETISLGMDGTPLRTVNIKDGYVIQLAMKMGLRVASSRVVRLRLCASATRVWAWRISFWARL